MYFWLLCVFVAARGLFSFSEQGLLLGCSVWVIIAMASLVSESGLQSAGISGCGNRLSCPTEGVESSSRDGTHVPCVGRWIFNHWTTREVCFLYL